MWDREESDDDCGVEKLGIRGEKPFGGLGAVWDLRQCDSERKGQKDLAVTRVSRRSIGYMYKTWRDSQRTKRDAARACERGLQGALSKIGHVRPDGIDKRTARSVVLLHEARER